MDDYVLLVLVNLRRLRLSATLLLALPLPLLELSFVHFLLVIQFILHKVIDRDQLVYFKILFAMADLLLMLLVGEVVPAIDKVAEVFDGHY